MHQLPKFYRLRVRVRVRVRLASKLATSSCSLEVFSLACLEKPFSLIDWTVFVCRQELAATVCVCVCAYSLRYS